MADTVHITPRGMRLDRSFRSFLSHRKNMQLHYLETQLDTFKAQHRASGSTRSFADWLTEEVDNVVTESGRGVWHILFTTEAGGDGRAEFIEAFNRLLRRRRIPAELYEDDEALYFDAA